MQTQLLQEWKFRYGDCPGADYRDFDDTEWESVVVPHDWSVTFPFSKNNSSGTGYLPGGTGWYRTTFSLSKSDKKKTVTITFDGVYNNSQVWCNGHNLGCRPSGYTTFTYDISEFVDWESRSNTLALKVEHTDFADSRWFTGSGLYRKVSLAVSDCVYIPWDGVFFTTPQVTEKQASIAISASVTNDYSSAFDGTITATIEDATGQPVFTAVQTLQLPAEQTSTTQLEGILASPSLWSPESPYLYRLTLSVECVNSEGLRSSFLSDPIEIGIRHFSFHPDNGFFLNDRSMKIKGVCVHHDAGCLGAAVWPQVWQRRLEKLKEMGCNAIRMAHNPHMKELYQLCDRMGFFVMDEAFDEWEGCKNKWWQGHNVYPPKHFGYSKDFPVWHALDLSELIKRNRNHASIIFWSVGNEIDYPNDPYCHPLFQSMTGNNDKNKPKTEMIYDKNKPNSSRLSVVAAQLTKIVKEHDPTRPVLAACAFPELSTHIGYADSFDVIGYNYKEHLYEDDHKRLPSLPILGSENGHGWDEWKSVRDNDYISAQFLWTGIDFLGETEGWPNHGSSAGLLTVAGYEKTDYYRRKAMWAEEPFAYLATRPQSLDEIQPWTFARHWDYLPKAPVQVICYTNLEQGELFVNGTSHGLVERGDKEYLLWSIPFNKGDISVKNAAGSPQDTLSSTLAPTQILWTLWNPSEPHPLSGDYQLHQIELAIADENGNRCATNSSIVSVSITGEGRLLGIENGDLTDTSEYSLPMRHAYEGRVILYVLAKKDTPIVVDVSANHGISASIPIL